MNDPSSDEGEVDCLLQGRLVLRQRRGGHRAGTDAVILAAAAGAEPGDRVVDVGAGVGTVGLAVALQQPDCTTILVDDDAPSTELASANIIANQLGDRVQSIALDVFDTAACRRSGLGGCATLALSNPPFYIAGTVRASPDPARSRAHVLESRGIADHGGWLRRVAWFLRPGGRLLVIHRPEALPDLLRACRGLGGVRVKAIHAKANTPAIRILLGATQGSRAPLTLLPPLVLHRPDGGFTVEAASLHQGAGMRFWPEKSRPVEAGLLCDAQ